MGNFGIADKLSDIIEERPWIYFIAASCLWCIVLMYTKPSLWLVWLSLSPALAWQSSILLPILALIETLIYWALQPKKIIDKIKERFMKLSAPQFQTLCICATVAVVAISAMVVLRQPSPNDDAPPEYFAVHISGKQHCVMIHTNPSCNNSHMTLMPARELYHTAENRHGMWTVRYNDLPDYPMRFCAKCVSTAQMSAIIDSIVNFDEYLHSEEFGKLIDELSTMKEIHAQKEQNVGNREWVDSIAAP